MSELQQFMRSLDKDVLRKALNIGLIFSAFILTCAMYSKSWVIIVINGTFDVGAYAGLWIECFQDFCSAKTGGLFYRMLAVISVFLAWVTAVGHTATELDLSYHPKIADLLRYVRELNVIRYTAAVAVASGAWLCLLFWLFGTSSQQGDSRHVGFGWWLFLLGDLLLSVCYWAGNYDIPSGYSAVSLTNLFSILISLICVVYVLTCKICSFIGESMERHSIGR